MTRATHAGFWRAIDRIVTAHGLSTSGLAVKAGLDATAFNKSKRVQNGRARWPSTESVAKVLPATDESMETFVALMDRRAK